MSKGRRILFVGQGEAGEELRHEIHLLHLPGLAVQVFQTAAFRSEGKGELIGPEGLYFSAVCPVVPFPAVFSVTQQGVTGGGELGTDLVCAACDKLALYEGKSLLGREGTVEGDGGLSAGDGGAVDGDLFFGFILEEKALQPTVGRVELALNDAEIFF